MRLPYSAPLGTQLTHRIRNRQILLTSVVFLASATTHEDWGLRWRVGTVHVVRRRQRCRAGGVAIAATPASNRTSGSAQARLRSGWARRSPAGQALLTPTTGQGPRSRRQHRATTRRRRDPTGQVSARRRRHLRAARSRQAAATPSRPHAVATTRRHQPRRLPSLRRNTARLLTSRSPKRCRRLWSKHRPCTAHPRRNSCRPRRQPNSRRLRRALPRSVRRNLLRRHLSRRRNRPMRTRSPQSFPA